MLAQIIGRGSAAKVMAGTEQLKSAEMDLPQPEDQPAAAPQTCAKKGLRAASAS
jgi:hypothetical protein